MAKPNANSGQKADFAVKLVLMFFISLLSFSVGTYLGKQVSDADYQRAAREAEYGGTHHSTLQGHVDEANESTEAIRDEDVASLTEEFLRASRNTASESPVAEPTETKPTAPAQNDGYTHHSKMMAQQRDEIAAKAEKAPVAKPATTVEKAVKKAADRIAEGLAPTADEPKKRNPTAVLPTVATTAVGKFTVQVASYATSKEAGSYAEQLLGKGYPAFVVMAEVNGKTWHRVSIGRFADQNTAKVYRTELLAAQAVPTAIVQKVIK